MTSLRILQSKESYHIAIVQISCCRRCANIAIGVLGEEWSGFAPRSLEAPTLVRFDPNKTSNIHWLMMLDYWMGHLNNSAFDIRYTFLFVLDSSRDQKAEAETKPFMKNSLS
ncbi:hypothetical protein WN943_007461 [Citrus x changshan-huyou]